MYALMVQHYSDHNAMIAPKHTDKKALCTIFCRLHWNVCHMYCWKFTFTHRKLCSWFTGMFRPKRERDTDIDTTSMGIEVFVFLKIGKMETRGMNIKVAQLKLQRRQSVCLICRWKAHFLLKIDHILHVWASEIYMLVLCWSNVTVG